MAWIKAERVRHALANLNEWRKTVQAQGSIHLFPMLALIEAAASPLTARHAAEVAELEARIAQYGERGSGKKQLADQHKRELRRHRTDELLAGMTVIAGTYRDSLAAGTVAHPDRAVAAVQRIHADMEAFAVNANETLLLQALLWALPPL